MNILPIEVKLLLDNIQTVELSVDNENEIELSSEPITDIQLFTEGDVICRLALESNIHEIGLAIEGIGTDYPQYHGITEITPSENRVVLNTKDTIVLQNIVVNPIPSNWGRIGWNGSYLTVS